MQAREKTFMVLQACENPSCFAGMGKPFMLQGRRKPFHNFARMDKIPFRQKYPF